LNSIQFLKDDEVHEGKWLQLLDKSAFASPFQTPAFYKINRAANQIDAHVFAVEENDVYKVLVVVTVQQERGLISYFSRRGIIFGGPILDDCSVDVLKNFLMYVATCLQQKVIYLETRNYFDIKAYKKAFDECGWQYTPNVTIQLNITGKTNAELLSSLTSNRRNEIKKSISQGVSYGLCHSENEVIEIYKILKELYSNKVKLPIPNVKYFIEMYKDGLMKAFFVKHDGIVIGGSFCMVLSGKGLYTFYYCGLSYYKKNIYPTHLAILAALEYAIANDIPHIDFMGAGKPNEKYGVREYKSQFGGTLVEHGRFLYVSNQFLYNLGKKAIQFMKKMPLNL